MALDTAGATAFEEHLVSRVFGPWAQFVVALAAPRRGERVVDVACATGAATRAAAAAAGRAVFPDRVGALREMRRVLAPDGRLFVSVWASIEHAPGYHAVAQALERECIDTSSIRQAFALGDAGHVENLLEDAGFSGDHDPCRGAQRFFPFGGCFSRDAHCRQPRQTSTV